MVQPRMNTELLPIIDHLQAMVATLEGLTTILRKMAARPWPESPDGEGIAGDDLVGEGIAGDDLVGEGIAGDDLVGEPSAGILPAGSLVCFCGHTEAEHQSRVGGMSWCKCCACNRYTPTLTDPRD